MSLWKARRRSLAIFGALALTAALAVLVSGAGATSKCEEEVLGTATFTDATGDGVPDISQVTVSTFGDGATAFAISLADVSAFGNDMLVRTLIDADRNAATGNDGGYEYMIQSIPASIAYGSEGVLSAKCEGQAVSTLYAWSGSAWVEQETETLDSWYSDSSLTVRLNASELGDAMSFDFSVYAAAKVTYTAGEPDISGATFDWAPDKGSYTYKPFDWSSYVDPAGDGSAEGAPDITTVGVTNWKGDLLKFAVAVPETEWFAEGMLMRIMIDSDSNAATGSAEGYEYMIQAFRPAYSSEGILRAMCYQPTVTLLAWDGTAWKEVEDTPFDFWYSKGLKLELAASAIGDPSAFNFSVYAATNVTLDEAGWPDLTKAAFDSAPDTGTYAFPLTTSTAELAGDYTVKYKITKSTGALKPGKSASRVWNFKKHCAKKKCSTKANVKGLGQYKLNRAGKAAYKAGGGQTVSCSNSAAATTTSFNMKVKKSGWVESKWRVTKWVGTLKVSSAKASKCGGYTAALTGTLKR
jgi:hypothetical protein